MASAAPQMASAVKRVKEIPVAISSLDARVRAQAFLAGRMQQGAGWAILTLAVLDCVGNIIGVPILTGSIAAGLGGAGTFPALILQLALFAAAIRLLYKSNVRLWVMDETYDPQTIPEDQLQQRFVKGAAQVQNFFTTVRASVDQRLSGVNQAVRVAILIALVVFTLVAIFFVRHLAAVAIALTAAYILQGSALLRTIHAIGPRIRDEEDNISKMGIVAGGVAALLLFLLVGLQMKTFLPYVRHAYFMGDVVILQVCDIVLLAFLVFLVQLAAKRSRDGADYYLITADGPQGGASRRPVVQSFDFSSQQTVPIFGRFDENSLPTIVVVSQNSTGAYEIANPRRFLALHHRKIHVLDMRQFSAQLPKNVPYKDPFGYFTGNFSFSAIARSTAAMPSHLLSHAHAGAPEQLVSLMITDLFINPSLGEFLSRTAVEAIERYLGKREQIRTIREFIGGLDAERHRQGSLTPELHTTASPSSALDVLRLADQLLSHTKVASHYETYQTQIAAKWFPWREKLGPASAEIPAAFKAVLKEYFLNVFRQQHGASQDLPAIETWIELLLNCCDISMSLNTFQFEATDATVLDNRLLALHQEIRIERDRYIERANFTLGRLNEVLLLDKKMDQEVKLGLINVLPGLMPFLISSPLGNEVVKSLVSHGIQIPAGKAADPASAPEFIPVPPVQQTNTPALGEHTPSSIPDDADRIRM